MQLGRLEGFFHVARQRGYARAARVFPYPITQPGVHQQVKKLEQEIGVPLFERVSKDELRLTSAGERLYAFVAPFLESLPGVLEAIRSETFGGVLRVDASGLVLRQLLPGWLRALRAARPDISVDVEEIQAPDFERLRTGATHLLVDYCERVPPGHESRRVAVSHGFLVLPSDHPLARRRELDPRALCDVPFVSYHPSLPHHALQMDAVSRQIGVPARTISASSVDAILAFVRAGLGFSVIPWLDRRGPELEGVVVRRQRGPKTSFPILAVWRSSEWGQPLVEAALAAAPSAA